MRRHLTFLLTILCASMMGSQCEYGASVNNGIAVEEGASGPDGTKSGSSDGLVIVVRDGTLDAGTSLQQGGVIATALSTGLVDLSASTRTPPPSESPGFPSPAPIAAGHGRPNVEAERAVSPVPEPRGLLLFALGLGAVVTGTGSLARRSQSNPR